MREERRGSEERGQPGGGTVLWQLEHPNAASTRPSNSRPHGVQLPDELFSNLTLDLHHVVLERLARHLRARGGAHAHRRHHFIHLPQDVSAVQHLREGAFYNIAVQHLTEDQFDL